MKKANKFLALILTATLLFNSVNYEVIAEEVSEQVQKYKVMQAQNIETQVASTQEELQTTEKEETKNETEIINFVEGSEKVTESEASTEAMVTETEQTSPIETQINMVKNEQEYTTDNSANTEDIKFAMILDKDQEIISNEEYSENTKIEGSLTVKSKSVLKIKRGTVLEINGDLNIESGALFEVSDEGIKVIVRGDINIEGRLHVSNSSVMLEGNIIEKGSLEIQDACTLVLIGNEQQIIDTKSRIGRLINKNTSDLPLVFINSLNFELYEDNGKGIVGVANYQKDDKGNYTIQEGPITIENRTNFFVREKQEQAIVNKELIIHSDLCIKGNVDVNIAVYDTDNVTLRVKGNYIQENGYFKTYNQNMIVQGNFEHKGGTFEVMGSDTKVTVLGNMTIQDNTIFKMTEENSRVIVNGDFTISNTNFNEFTNGIMEIKGDFSQEGKEENFKLINDENSLNNHKVILNGDGKQTINFSNPTLINADKSLNERHNQFATLELSNPFYSYDFKNDLNKERVYENLIETYDYDSYFDKNNDKPYRKRKELDKPKSHLELVNANGYIFAIGGEEEQGVISGDISRYNFEKNTWTYLDHLQEKRMDFAAAAANNDIYVFGGYNGTNLLNKIEVISSNGSVDTVTLNQDSEIIERRAHEAVQYNGKIYIIGGEDAEGNSLTTLEVFDLSTKTIETKASMGVGRKNFGASLCLIGNKFYIVVAGGENKDGILNSVEIYDIEGNAWSDKVENLITARKGLELEFIMGKLFAVGGVSKNQENEEVYLNTVEGFDGVKWTELKDETNEDVCTFEKRGYFGSTVAYNSIFIAGGETPSKSDSFEQFMPINIPGVRFKGNTKGLNGDFTQEETDLVFNTPLTQFSLNRIYNSQFKDEESDFLGFGWKFNFESSLKKMSRDIGTVNALYLNVRDNPWGRIVGGVEKGTLLEITDTVPDAYGKMWYKISGGYYVASWYVDEVKNNAVEVSYPNGTKGYFIDNGEGIYKANFGTYETITFSSDENSYEITTKEQTKYVYSQDLNGKYRNTAIIDKYGNEIKIDYTSTKIEVTNNVGGKITITKGLDNNVTATYESGREVTDELNTNKELIKVTYELNTKKELIKVTDTLGLTTEYKYDKDNNNIVQIDKTSKEETITTSQVEYDKTGRIYKYTDAEGAIRYNFYEDVYMDESNEVLGIAGNLRRCVVDAKKQETVTTYSLVEKRPIVVIDAEKGVTKYKYEILYKDSYVDVTNLKDGDDLYKNTYKEIMKGQYPTRETIKDSNSQTTVIEKDKTGNIIKKTNPDGSFIEYKYDEKNNLTEEFNNANGHQIKTTYVYDKENIYLQSVEKGTSNDKSNETYTYDNSCNIKGLVKTKITKRDDSTNVETNYTYNETGELITEQIGNGNTYNETGELTQEEIGNRNTYLAHSYGFFDKDKEIDINGNKIIVEKPNNEYEKGIYYVLVKVKPEGNIEITQYDKKLNPIKITQSNSDGTEKSTTLIVYDEYGRKIREVKPEVYAENPKTADNLTEGCHIYKYNNSGLVKEEIDDENNTTSYEYDSKGNLIKEIDPGNTKYSYEYDAMDRLITKSYKDEGDLKELESFAYERGTEKSSSNKAFKQIHVEKIDDKNILSTATYFDYAGRETIIENQYKIIEKEYYGDGNIKRESVKTPDGEVCLSEVLYFYNDKGLLDVTLTAYELGKTRTYFITKNIYTNDNLLKYEIKYLDAQEVDTTKNTVPLPEEAKASVIKYDYDEIGNVTLESTYIGLLSLSNLSTAIFAKKVEKSYDIPNNKIKEISGDIKTEYTYNYLDKPVVVKNIVKKNDIFITKDTNKEDQKDQETGLITTNSYDKNGNIIKTISPSNKVTEYTYDKLDRLLETKHNNVLSEDSSDKGTLSEINSYNWAGNVVKKELKFNDLVKSKSEYYYDSRNNLLVSIDKVDGKEAVHSYEYNNLGQVIAEATPESFSALDKTETVPVKKYSISNAKSRTKYTYDLIGRLKLKEFVGKTYKLNTETGKMVGTGDSFVVQAYKYDANDNIIKEIDGEEYKKSSEKSSGVDETIENANGKISKYSGTGNLLSEVYPEEKANGKEYNVSYTYDALGNIVEEKKLKGTSDAEQIAVTKTSYIQDENGTITYTQETPELMQKTWQTNVNGNVIAETIGKRKVKKEYNSLGLESKVEREVDRYIENGEEKVVNSEVKTIYDEEGNPKIIIKNSGIVEINEYDNLGRLKSKTTGKRPANVADNELKAEQLTESVTNEWVYDVQGNVRYEYDGKGFKTENQYDELNRLVNTIKKYGSNKVLENKKSYDLDGNLIEEVTVLDGVETKKETFLYDGLGRIIQKSNADVVYESIEYNNSSDQEFSYDAQNVKKEFVYNANRQHIKTILSGICTEEQGYDYAGNVYKKIDGEGNTTLYHYDGLDRLVKVSTFDGEKETEISSYTYNAEGNINKEINGSKNTVTFEYTASDSIKERNTGGKVEKFFYNSDGNVEKTIDPSGNEKTYIYTAQGLVSKEEVKKADKVVITKSYTYDENGNVEKSIVNENGKENIISREYDELGRVTKKEATDSITSTFKYDVFVADKLLCEIVNYENGKSSSKVYDKFGRLKYVYSMDISSGADAKKRTEYNYDIKGRRESVIYPNGSKSTYEYYDNNNLKTLTNYVKDKEVEKYEYSYYKNNAMSSKKETYDGVLQGVTTYEYDELVRLKSIKEERNELPYREVTYSFDDSGNRSQEITTLNGVKTTKDYAYGAGNLLLGYTVTEGEKKTDEIKYEYDKNGNLIGEYIVFENGTEYTNNEKPKTINKYNELNQLISSKTDGLIVNNEYNSEGLRISKEVKNIGKNSTIDTVDKNYYTYEYDEVIFETSTKNPENLVWNVYGINLISRELNGEMFYCLYNGHADITRMVDENGELVEKYYYDEWGVETETLKYGDLNADNNVDITDYTLIKQYALKGLTNLSTEQIMVSDLNGDGKVDVDDTNILKQIIVKFLKCCPVDTNQDGFINEKNNIKYAGYFYDGETGLYYLNARFYDPETARFIQEDTYRGGINDPLSLNLYTYSHNNPISYYDPTGHSIKKLGDMFKIAATTVKAIVIPNVKKTVKKTAKTLKEDWQSGVDELKKGGVVSQRFASYSEGAVGSLVTQAQGVKKFLSDPLGTIEEAALQFADDPFKNNPVYGVYDFYKGIAQASYNSDWDAVAYKLGQGTTTTAVVGLSGGLGKKAAGLVAPKGINLNLNLGINQMVTSSGLMVATQSIAVSFSAASVASVSATMAGALASQGIMYASSLNNNDFSNSSAGKSSNNTSSGGKTSQGSSSGGGKNKNVGDFVEITLKQKEGMPVNEFNRKANALKDLGDQGLLYKAENPVLRDPSITRAYRQDMIKRIWNQYGKSNPEFANKLIDRVTTKMQPDHVWELQLGGPDTASNLKFLDSYTNWDIGTQQIRPQIRNFETGTKIRIKIEK